MSPINFDISERERPDLKEAWAALRAWRTNLPNSTFFDLFRLGKMFPNVSAEDLVDALETLQIYDQVKNVYKLRSPEGDLLNGEYEDIEQIPERVSDRLKTHMIDTAECEIVPGFSLGQAGVKS